MLTPGSRADRRESVASCRGVRLSKRNRLMHLADQPDKDTVHWDKNCPGFGLQKCHSEGPQGFHCALSGTSRARVGGRDAPASRSESSRTTLGVPQSCTGCGSASHGHLATAGGTPVAAALVSAAAFAAPGAVGGHEDPPAQA